jgi:hypothetical protein
MILPCFLLLFFISGCSLNTKPTFDYYDADGKPRTTKRYRRHLNRDFIARVSKTAYKKNKGTGPHFLLSKDQKDVKEKYGPPEYIGCTYLSRRGDYVKEWIYWKEAMTFQFVNKNLIFEGSLTDKERVLIVFGYPDYARVFQFAQGQERENFYYYTLFGMTQRIFHFINGKRVQSFYLQ